jgi:hypothetical protein
VATGSTVRLTNRSLWGTGPVADDVLQGQNADCYLNASLAGLARYSPDRLRETAVDLGDGTYAVQFVRGGVKSFVRVDGDLPAGGPYAGGLMYNHPGPSGNLWAAIIEKAYAVFRTNSNSYASLNYGVPATALTNLGIDNYVYTPGTDANAAYTTISAALASGRAVVFGTNPTIVGNAPLAGGHGYTVIGAAKDAFGNVTFTLRNPWGFDGAGSDSNPSDGIVTITFAQLAANNYASAIVL